jgi:hypothetical protein
MQISFGKAVTESRANLVLLAAMAHVSCSSGPEQTPVVTADKPFAAAGSIEMQLDGGDYSIRAGTDERIRVSFAGNNGNAAAIWRPVARMRIWQSEIRGITIFGRRSKFRRGRTSPSISPVAISRSPPSQGRRILTAWPGTSAFRSQTPMTTVLWTLPSRLGISTPDPLVILARDFPRTSNGRDQASTPCAPVSAPATWN